jgi:transposase-like protein
MSKIYSAEERSEAVRLAAEIGTKAASERLGINIDTVYTWISKAKRRAQETATTVAAYGGPEGMAAENERLRKLLHEREQEVEILQDALGFFVKRQKK